MRPPRLLITTTASQTLSFMRGFPEYLTEHGWQVHVAAAPGPDLEAYADTPDITIHEVPMERAPSPRDLRSLATWISLLRRVRPDIIFTASPKASLLSMLAGKICGVPARCYAIVGLRLETTTGPLHSVLWAMEKLTISSSTRQCVVSPSLGRRLDELALTGGDWDLVGAGSFFGLHLEQFFAPPKRSLTSPGPVIGYVGRITHDKGMRELAAAFAEIRASFPEARLLIVGPDEGGRDYIQAVADAVTFTGPVPNPAPYYAEMDVFAFPTYREGFGSVVIEAQAAGVPVVSSDATGARDAIGEGQAGLMVPVGDANALASALGRVLTDTQLRQELQDRGQQWARQFARPELWREYDQWLRRQLRATRGAKSHR